MQNLDLSSIGQILPATWHRISLEYEFINGTHLNYTTNIESVALSKFNNYIDLGIVIPESIDIFSNKVIQNEGSCITASSTGTYSGTFFCYFPPASWTFGVLNNSTQIITRASATFDGYTISLFSIPPGGNTSQTNSNISTISTPDFFLMTIEVLYGNQTSFVYTMRISVQIS